MRTKWLSLALCLAASACTPGVPARIDNPAVELLTGEALPAPTARDLQAGTESGVVHARDLLSIEVFGVPDLTRRIRVGVGGTIDYPLVGEVTVAGLTPAEVGSAIAARLRGRYVRDPHVSVNVADWDGRTVTVDGAVAAPGNYAVIGDMTLMRAIASAGGLAGSAVGDDVVIVRTIDGRRMAGRYDLGAIRVGNDEDPAIYPDDIVIVGKSPARQMFAKQDN